MGRRIEMTEDRWKRLLGIGIAIMAAVALLALAQCGSNGDAEPSTPAADASASNGPPSVAVPEAGGQPSEAATSANAASEEPADQPQSAHDGDDLGTSETGSSSSAVSQGEAHSPGNASESPDETRDTAISDEQTGAGTKRWVEETVQVWVVDSPAWEEQTPVYDSRELSICNICGADITGNTAAHGKEHMLAGEGSGHHSEVRQVLVGYNTVQHGETGHYETVVTGGHWE